MNSNGNKKFQADRKGPLQTVDKVPDRSPGFSFIKFSTFLTFFHRFTKKNGSVINFIFQGFSSTS
ncbi:hypothetical protein DW983_11925 [Ruminococcus sp. AM49-8]|nr:hypothetical protein DW983_11925 [Ruminococcus sp. AM49-8]RGF99541.1 hypothetical protein DW977_11735 [Ruminococcus sp. AM49-10BH]RGI20297.1 hypothetical protein DXC84_04880 [Ruminococcus sp. TF08-4]RGI48143.1 hypothetical protein DXB52_09040 [Ruminococcus sp. OM04-4AA]